MKTFKDREGRTWRVDVNVATIKMVAGMTEPSVDLLDAFDRNKNLFRTLASNPVLLVDVLYAMCHEQAVKEEKVSDVEFGRAMAGDVIMDATDALLEELVNFTPDRRDRARMQRLREKVKVLEDETQAMLDERIENPKVLDAIREEIRIHIERLDQPGTSSTNSPGSSE